jgi:mersacidin/lichenicidin family type 2 lantibiotic
MTPDQIVRAWKDADYCSELASTEQASRPPNPIGPIDLTDQSIDLASGGDVAGTEYLESIGCCKGITQRGFCDTTAGWPFCTMGCLSIVWSGAC